MNNMLAQPGQDLSHVNREVDRLLERSPAYGRLDPAARHDLKRDVVKIASYLASGDAALEGPYSSQMAPDLRAALAPRQAQPQPDQPQTAPSPGTPATQPAAAPQAGATARAGDVARAT